MALQIFQKWSNELPERVTGKHDIHRKACIVPSLFWATWYLDNKRCFPGDCRPNRRRLQNTKQNNIKFLQTKFSSSRKDFSSPGTSIIPALSDFFSEEELLVHHGN